MFITLPVSGSGLGLAIAWQLVEAHGDRIRVESWALVMGQGLAEVVGRGDV